MGSIKRKHRDTHAKVICHRKLRRVGQLAYGKNDEVVRPYSHKVCLIRLLVVPSDEYPGLCPLPGTAVAHRSLDLECLEDISNSYDVPIPNRWLYIHGHASLRNHDPQPSDREISGRVPKLFRAWIGGILQINGEGWGGEGMLDEGVEVESVCEEPEGV